GRQVHAQEPRLRQLLPESIGLAAAVRFARVVLVTVLGRDPVDRGAQQALFFGLEEIHDSIGMDAEALRGKARALRWLVRPPRTCLLRSSLPANVTRSRC